MAESDSTKELSPTSPAQNLLLFGLESCSFSPFSKSAVDCSNEEIFSLFGVKVMILGGIIPLVDGLERYPWHNKSIGQWKSRDAESEMMLSSPWRCDSKFEMLLLKR